jgi:CubicO group peptidase (beta-lactamase class C family)
LGRADLRAQERPDSPVEFNRSILNESSLDSLLRPLFINKLTDRYIAGAAIGVVYEGRLVYSKGFGDREVFSEDPVDASRTIFRIGSITKVLTGIAVMQLVDRGLVDLDADVNQYLTDVQVPDTFEEPVRVRHLLTHTAGFDQIGLDRHADGPEDVEPLGEWLSGKLIRIRPPGTGGYGEVCPPNTVIEESAAGATDRIEAVGELLRGVRGSSSTQLEILSTSAL